jgi:hypothetical protein
MFWFCIKIPQKVEIQKKKNSPFPVTPRQIGMAVTENRLSSVKWITSSKLTRSSHPALDALLELLELLLAVLLEELDELALLDVLLVLEELLEESPVMV